MTELPVRRLLVDLESPLDRHWNGGDAFRTAFFNALSMSFPVGEQFFIDSVRAGMAALPEAERQRREPELRGFIGQEATHRRIHALFNAHLERQGLVNRWEPRIRRRLVRLQGVDLRAGLAVTAATEHFTAIMAEHLLGHDGPLAGAERRLQLLWHWHASEEIEHRSVAFDLYRSLGGSERWRRRIFWLVSWYFCSDVLRQTANNLWRDGSWWRVATWAGGARFLLGREGLLPSLFRPWRAYLQADFHPARLSGPAGADWLLRHQADYLRVVGGVAGTLSDSAELATGRSP